MAEVNFDVEGDPEHFDETPATLPHDGKQKRTVKSHLVASNSLALACRLARVDPATVKLWRLTDKAFDDFCRQHDQDLTPQTKSINRRVIHGTKG